MHLVSACVHFQIAFCQCLKPASPASAASSYHPSQSLLATLSMASIIPWSPHFGPVWSIAIWHCHRDFPPLASPSSSACPFLFPWKILLILPVDFVISPSCISASCILSWVLSAGSRRIYTPFLLGSLEGRWRRRAGRQVLGFCPGGLYLWSVSSWSLIFGCGGVVVDRWL